MATRGSAKEIVITAPNFQVVEFTIVGTAPYVQHKFSEKAKNQIKAKQEAGPQSGKGGPREAKDFQAVYEAAKHISTEGWCGIPASCFRNAMISACRLAGFTMTRAKLGVFVMADGFDRDEGTPLVRITEGEPSCVEHWARNETGVVDLRARPMWQPGWKARLRVRFDADMFSASDVAKLLMRVGQQVGIGEGRPDSPNSAGMGWGLFDLAGSE